MSFLPRQPALQTRLATLIAGLPQYRLGITAILSVAFLTVAVLAAAANLISERGLQITRTTYPAQQKPTVEKTIQAPPVVIAAVAETPRVISIDSLLIASARFEQTSQSRALMQGGLAKQELQRATEALRLATDDLVRESRDRSDARDRRKLIGDLGHYQMFSAQLVQAADTQRQLITEHASRYEAMHARARASIDSAWKVFGRVVARQALVTLNSQVEDLGRRPASLIADSDNADEIAEAMAGSERAIARTLLENERSLASSQGKEWLAQMNEDLAALSASREQLLQTDNALRISRAAMANARTSLETAAHGLATIKPEAKPASPETTVPVLSPISSRANHLPSETAVHTVSTTVDSDVHRKIMIAWISGGVLSLLILICIVTVRSIVGPVRRLMRATVRIAAGELDVRVHTGGIKELSTLSVAFNDMAERLDHADRITRDYQAELELKVRERTEELNVLASQDTLTALPNRREMFMLLDAALVRAAAEHTFVGVFFLDIDNFKNINDGMGHAFGDQVLQAVAARLQIVAASFGFAARQGGDEFTVVITTARSVDDIRAAGLQLVTAFNAPLMLPHRELTLSISVGASVFPEHEREANLLLQAADAALFRAKALGRSQLHMFSPDLLATAVAKFATEQGLRRALEKDEFVLVFQPEMNLATMQVELVEALIRWRQPDGSLMAPGEFLSVAEESGLIMEISDWVLRSAISAAARWHHGSWPEARVAINVSSRQLIDATFVDRVISLLHEFRLPVRCIEIELTESVLQTGPVTLEALHQLRAQGIAIALDDFGTGYSSLASLQQLPLTRIKLDRSLLNDIDSSPRTLSIARSIVALSRSLGLHITAEGIERAEQLAILLGEGDLFVQGYLLSRPLAEVDVIAALSVVAQRTQELLLPSPASLSRMEKIRSVVSTAEEAVSVQRSSNN
jgi:diguanylate cyclase (GGDEF)-like protein